ncbi:poly-gamma-glutamate system protein [Roseiconus nitratireducens]|uniref:Poly-gamma-glutamate system protein n=1 Tax=Roseiconus nitratireducens TaxID=2605748 RepID=A0A5M6D810_9BACT|nr:poly-gamma-glutamate system protein [Roseiconus nitratireducens]KAA5541315.1 poly-gamma-glutamate system protein [Roseiconus nitratireducens]
MKTKQWILSMPKRPHQVMYWRPKKISSAGLWAGMVVTLLGLAFVQMMPQRSAPDATLLTAAASKSHQAMLHIKRLQQERGHRVISKLDPQQSHLIGPSMSMVTSKLGSLESKQTSINPNLSAVIVRWLKEAGVKPGDRIAIGASGSWPAFNIAVYSAAASMDLKPTIILSAAASQYGANDPELMWVDMDRELRGAGIFPSSYAAVASSLGGLYDRAAGTSEQTRLLLENAIERNGLERIDGVDLADAVEQRVQLYDQHRDNDSYAAYINIGGGSASIGGTKGNRCLGAGIHRTAPPAEELPDCVASRMLCQNVPVINVVDAKGIAAQFGLPVAPVEMPEVGRGAIFTSSPFRRPFAAVVIGMTFLWMFLLVNPGWVFRSLAWIRRLGGKRSRPLVNEPVPQHLEWMV